MFCCLSKIYSASTVNVVSSNPSVGHLPKIKISLILLSAYTEGLFSTSNINTFFPNQLTSDDDKVPRISNLIPYLEWGYLSGS